MEKIEKLYQDYLRFSGESEDPQIGSELAEKLADEINRLPIGKRREFLLKILGSISSAAYMYGPIGPQLFNNKQLEYISTAFNAVAFAEFAAFGYTALVAKNPDWLRVGLSTLGFFVLEAVGVIVLSFSRSEGK